MKVKVIHKKESVIYKGEVFKKGAEIIMDDSVASGLIARGYVKAVNGEEPVETAENAVEEETLEKMSYQNLKRLAKDMGVNGSGTKEELIEKITAASVESYDDGEESGELPNTSMPE